MRSVTQGLCESLIRKCVGTACLLLVLSAFAAAQEKPTCTLPDCDQAKAFFEKFQRAIDTNERQAAASMVWYPLNSYRNGKATVVQNQTQFLAKYDAIFDAATRCALKAATVDDVWGNWRGFTISAGLMWWDRIIPNSAKNLQLSDLSKYPFGVFGVNHGPEVEKSCGNAATSKP
jgi:hypothetical protein